MEIWADDSEILIYDDSGLTFFSGAEVDAVCSPMGDPVTLGSRKGLKSSKHRILAFHPQSRLGVVGEPGEVPVLFDLARRTSVARLGFAWLAAHPISAVGGPPADGGSAADGGTSGMEFLGVVPEDGSYHLRRVRLSQSGSIEHEDSIPVPLPKPVSIPPLEWPNPASSPPTGKAGGKKSPPYEFNPMTPSEEREFIGPVAIHSNRFGTTVADLTTGMVVLLDAACRSCRCAVQLPASGGESIGACATRDGMVITAAMNENHSGFALVRHDGSLACSHASWPGSHGELITGLGAPVLAGESTVVLPHSTHGAALTEFDLSTDSVVGEWKIPGGSAYFDRAVSSDDGSSLFTSRATVLRAERVADGSWTGTVIERKNLPKKVKDPQTVITGAPQLQLKAREESWRASVGQPLKLSFALMNTGGEGSGIELELSGDAVSSGKISPMGGRAGAAELNFEAPKPGIAVAKLPSLAVRPAMERGTKRTKIEPWELDEITLELTPHSAGAGLLMVRVRTSGGGSAATGKTLVVC